MSRPWKVARDGLERVLAVRDLVRRVDPAEPLGRRDEQPVVGPDVETPVRAAQRERAAIAPTPGSTTARCTPSGMYGSVFASTSAPWRTRLRRDPVRDVDDLDLGRDPLDHAVAGADEVVLEPEVGQERDEHVSATVTNRPPRRGRRGRASRPRRRPRGRLRAPPRVVCGPIETAGMSPPSAANDARRRAGREHDEVALRRAPRAAARACGRAGRSRRRARRRAAGARPRRAAKRTRPAGRGNSASRPSWVETRGTRSARRRARAASRRSPGRPRRPAAARPGVGGELARAVRARHDDPVVALDTSIGSSPSGSISISGHTHDLVSELLEPARRAARPAPSAA